MNKIGKNIRILRNAHKMSQDDLAAKLFVSRQTISNYENGKSNPDIEMIIHMGEVFETDANELIYGVTEKPDPDRKKDLRKSIILSVLCLVLFVVLSISDQKARDLIKDWLIASPETMIREVLWPAYYLLAGWTGMFLLQTLTGAKLKWKKPAAIVFGILMFLLTLYVIVNLPFWIWMIRRVILDFMLINSGGTYTVDDSFTMFPLWNYLWYQMRVILNNRNELFIIAGVGLCLTRSGRSDCSIPSKSDIIDI